MQQRPTGQEGRRYQQATRKGEQDPRADHPVGQGPASELVGEHARGGAADPDEGVDDAREPRCRLGEGGRHRGLDGPEHETDGRRHRDPGSQQARTREPTADGSHAGVVARVEQREPELAAHQQHQRDAEGHHRGDDGCERGTQDGPRHIGDLVGDRFVPHRDLDPVPGVGMPREARRPGCAGQRTNLGVGRPHDRGERQRHPERGGPEEEADEPEDAEGAGHGDDDEGAAMPDAVGQGPHQRGSDDAAQAEGSDQQACGGEGTGEYLAADQHGERQHRHGQPRQEGQQHPGGARGLHQERQRARGGGGGGRNGGLGFRRVHRLSGHASRGAHPPP